jgi:hypothetical protein
MNKQIFLVAAIIAALGLTTTAFIQANAALPTGCTGNPHDRDSGPVGNPHDASANGAASGFETGNPHDDAAHGGPHHQEGPDICPGAQ